MKGVSLGLGVRDAYVDELLRLGDKRAVDVLEVMIDDGLGASPRAKDWRRLGAKWPLVAHGTELGIGSATDLDASYLAEVGRAASSLSVHWYSEHWGFVRSGDVELGHFAPVGASEYELAVLRENAGRVRDAIRCPLLLEHPSDILGWEADEGGAHLGARFAKALEAAEAGALIDLTNLVIDAKNDGYQPMEFLGALDFERVVEIHLAGGHFDGALHIDSHDHDVHEEALELLTWLAPRAPHLRAVIVERDDRLPPLDHLLGEVDRARRALARAGRA